MMTMPDASLLDELAPGAAALAVVEADYNIGPSIEAVDVAAPDDRYGTSWSRLERVLGMPAPYWHPSLRHPDLMTAWTPGAPTLQVPVCITPDPGPLLRLAAEEPDGSHAAAAALELVRRIIADDAQSTHQQIAEHVDGCADIASIAVAARPLMPTPPQGVAEEVLRDGWRAILSRSDVLAEQCARLADYFGSSRYFPGSRKVTVDPDSCPEARLWASRLRPSPRTALATYLCDTAQLEILIDPLTDMPAARAHDGKIETIAPQRLPTVSPLAALTVGKHSVWVRTEDATVFLAPQVGGGYTFGYAGGGPHALAQLIAVLLDDITNAAPGYGDARPPAGLAQATEEGWKGRVSPFTLTRAELQALRDR
ncbi:hypothetical protein AB0K89_28090 [Streptomyces cinnamoneus]|uniref:hypothetical protein n=1 Tax=Streptomyces cinnamoneus TaxID=53446 RepID=UPI003439F4F0